jgi:hypothetical protein
MSVSPGQPPAPSSSPPPVRAGDGNVGAAPGAEAIPAPRSPAQEAAARAVARAGGAQAVAVHDRLADLQSGTAIVDAKRLAALARIIREAEQRAEAIRASSRRCTVCHRQMVVQPAHWTAHMLCRPDLYGPDGSARDAPKRRNAW